MNSDVLGAAIFLLTGVLFLAGATHSLRPESSLRRMYGVEPADESAVRTNAAVVGLCGLGMVALASVMYIGVSERAIGVGAVVVSAGACFALGWLIRYRDRRELLTTPNVDRPTARRLGGVAMVCGASILALAPALWFEVGPGLLLGIAVGGSIICLLGFAYAYR